MRRIVLTFGLIAGAVMSAMMLITVPFHEQLGDGKGMALGYTAMVLASILIYVGIRQYRDVVLGGGITYWQGLKVGLLISAVAVACYVLTWQIIYYGWFPDFAEVYGAEAVRRAQESGASAAEIAKTAEAMREFAEAYKNPLVNIAYTILEPLPVVLLFSLVSAGLLRKPVASV